MADGHPLLSGVTTRLYYTDSYLRAFDATIVAIDDTGRRLYLAETAFYPTSGGQPHDLGTIAGVPLADVVDEGDRIAHVLAEPLAAATAGGLRAEIDWARRYDHMQRHTGQHLLSGVLEDLFGYKTVSVHFGDAIDTIDLDAEQVSREHLVAAEERANALVWENRPVTVTFEDAASAAGLRKASEREGALRIVTIDGVDRSACGGTHVRATGEIGAILVRGVEKMRKATRIQFLCGRRAVRRARADFEALGQIAAALSASADEAASLVAAQSQQLRDAENARRKMERELAEHRARRLHADTAPDARGRRLVVVRDASSMEELRTLAQQYATLPSAVMVGVIAAPPSVLYAASEDTGIDAGRALREVVQTLGGRGGGSPRVAQGSLADAAAVTEAVRQLTER